MRIAIDGFFGEITTLPGCNQVAVSHGVYTRTRGTGRGSAVNQKRCDLMHDIGYDYVLCTVDAANEAQIHIMENNGWRQLDTFQSTRTGHNVRIYGRSL